MADWKRITEVNSLGTAYILDEFIKLAVRTAAVCIGSMSAHMVPSTPELTAVLKNPFAPNYLETIEQMTKGSPGAAYALSAVKGCSMKYY